MSPVFAYDEKYNICLSFMHTHTHIYAHTHLTSAWNVVGASVGKRMENGVREGKGGRRERGTRRGKRSVEGI